MVQIGESSITEKFPNIPKGNYLGTWCAYQVWLYKKDTKEIQYRFSTRYGVKGTVKVLVHVENQKAIIYENTKEN